MFHLRRYLPLVLFFLLKTQVFCGERLTLGVSSNFLATMKILKQEFEKTYPIRLSLFQAHSLLYAQIKRGSPIDIFLFSRREKCLDCQKQMVLPILMASLTMLLVNQCSSEKKEAPFLNLNELKKIFQVSLLRLLTLKQHLWKSRGEVLKSYGIFEELQSQGKLLKGKILGALSMFLWDMLTLELFPAVLFQMVEWEAELVPLLN